MIGANLILFHVYSLKSEGTSPALTAAEKAVSNDTRNECC